MPHFAHAVFFAVLLVSGGAHADVVGPEPSSCPDGSRPSTCHGGPHCAAVACETDGDCESGKACREVSACIGVVNCAGLIGPGEDPSQYDRDTLEGLCEGGSTCPSDATCRTAKLCMAPGSGGGTGGTGSGGTGATAGTAGTASKTGGSGGSGASVAAGGDGIVKEPVQGAEDDAGCSCRLASDRSTGRGAVAAGCIALGLLARRRRRAGARTDASSL